MYKLSLYEGPIKQLIHQTKFDASRAGAQELGALVSFNMPPYRFDIVSYVPTDQSRVRYRGFDHAEEIAGVVALHSNSPLRPLLNRRQGGRQLGSSRRKRQKQMKEAFTVRSDARLNGAKVLLIDDVVSTAASIEAAAAVLKSAGAGRVSVAVAAHNR